MALRLRVALASAPATRKLVPFPESLRALLDSLTQLFAVRVCGVTLADGTAVESTDLLRDDDSLLAVTELDVSSAVETPPPSITAAPNSVQPASTSAARSTADRPPSSTSDHSTVGSVRPCVAADGCGWVRLCVGGKMLATTLDTLTKDTGSMLARMFGGELWRSRTDPTGAFLFDREPAFFEAMLNFLRYDRIVIGAGVALQGVWEEAQYFQVESMLTALQPLMAEHARITAVDGALNRRDVVSALLRTTQTDALRFQGVSLAGADLSRLDLRHINFKFADLQHCNLAGCNLQFCNFECANLAHAVLDGADLLGCHLGRADLRSSSLINCNFHDPAQLRPASLEGANLRSAKLDDSNLSGVNLRVACLKLASLANCTLRGANLAGTDLNQCDLTGCNLAGANLRGANTAGAQFHQLTEAVHMSQSVFSFVGPADPMHGTNTNNG